MTADEIVASTNGSQPEAGVTEGSEIVPGPESNMPDSAFPGLHDHNDQVASVYDVDISPGSPASPVVPSEGRFGHPPVAPWKPFGDESELINGPTEYRGDDKIDTGVPVPTSVPVVPSVGEQPQLDEELQAQPDKELQAMREKLRSDSDEILSRPSPPKKPSPHSHSTNRPTGRVSLDEAAAKLQEFSDKEGLGLHVQVHEPDDEGMINVPKMPDVFRESGLDKGDQPLIGTSGLPLMGFTYSMLLPNGDIIWSKVQVPVRHDNNTPHSDRQNLKDLADLCSEAMQYLLNELSSRLSMIDYAEAAQSPNRCDK